MIISLPSFEQLDLSDTYMVGDKRVMGDAQNRIKYISISRLILLENLIVIFQHEIFCKSKKELELQFEIFYYNNLYNNNFHAI